MNFEQFSKGSEAVPGLTRLENPDNLSDQNEQKGSNKSSTPIRTDKGYLDQPKIPTGREKIEKSQEDSESSQAEPSPAIVPAPLAPAIEKSEDSVDIIMAKYPHQTHPQPQPQSPVKA